MFNNRRAFLTGLVGISLAVVAMFTFAIREVEAKDPPQTRVEGRLTAKNVANRTVSIRVAGGAIRVLTIPASAKVERNGFKVGLDAFKTNDSVQARLLVDGVTVVKFEGTGP